MKRVIFLLYGVISYFAFFGTILYAIGFVGNFIVPKTIDGLAEVPLSQAILINSSLLLLFALQHSIMARQGFKKMWTKIIPAPLERSTYVLLSSICLALLMWLWQPMGGIIWTVDNTIVKTALLILYLSGWAIVFLSSFLINHFDLFGLRQAWLYFKDQPYTDLPFRLPFLYRFVRHPLYFGLLLAFWSASTMTVTHLFFAIMTTGYILTGIRFEEKDLLTHFGEKYRQYKKRVPMIIPTGRKKTQNQ